MFGDTPLIMIEDTEALEAMVEALMRTSIIGVDTEADSFHHYQERVCLIQLSDLNQDYIVDPLKIEDCSSLQKLFARPDLLTLLHGGDYDVVSMRRDFGVSFANIFDTMIASLFLGLPRIGLADLIETHFGYHIDKRYQRHDWSSRPLLDEHLHYARGDTHFLLALREILTLKLKRAGRYEAFVEECGILARREWTGRTRDPADFMRVKKSRSLDIEGRKVLRALWTWREARGQAIDRPVFKVLSDALMVAIASERPSSEDDLHKIIRKGSLLSRKHGADLLKAVADGCADERPLPVAPAKPRKRSAPRSGPGMDQFLGPLKAWRNNLVESKKLSPVVVANNQLLKDIARLAPTTREALSEVPGIRNWQVVDFGDEILEVVSGVPKPKKSRKRKRRRGKTSPDASSPRETSTDA